MTRKNMTRTITRKNRFSTRYGFALAGATLLLVAGQALAADAAKEVATAAQHAGYAADATVLGTVQSHLHHTINCLVGAKGAGFDANQANPCKDQGDGAINDTADAAKKKALQDAASKATAGLKQTDLAAAKKDAAEVAATIKKAM